MLFAIGMLKLGGQGETDSGSPSSPVGLQLTNFFSGLVPASSAVTGIIKYYNQMIFLCPFIVDRLDSGMHISQRGMTIKPTWLLLAPWSGSVDASARLGIDASGGKPADAVFHGGSWARQS